MQKRILSLLLAFILCLSMTMSMNASIALAADDSADQVTGQTYSDWALNDLMVGDTYGIYPSSWYSLDMTAPITRSQLKILVSELRQKILKTDKIVQNVDQIYRLDKTMSVEKVLSTLYTMLSGFEFTTDLGLQGKTASEYMKDNGIFTGANGELALKNTCSIEQACVFATRIITVVYDKLDAASKGFLWVTKSGGNTVYMLGSIHMASPDIYPLSNDILAAYNSADALAVELNLFDLEGANKVAELGVYTDGTTLKDHVSAETYQKTVELAAKFGYPEELISMIKPWYIYLMFASLALTDTASTDDASSAASLGLDYNFTANALITGKPILEVEGYEYQAKMLDSFSAELEEYLLNSTIDGVNDILAGNSSEGADSLDAMLQLWHDGDVEAFLKASSTADEYPEVYSEEASAEKALLDEFTLKLFTQRDANMADYIDGLLKAEGSHTYFIIVGSGHYISDHSVLDILKDKGYEITQIK
ncbi:MAG TPA: TraB/GumN family protein [Mobilitalea sp.]|nr:TraB/GumN family protein [Mobilitalea sp.]